jgi:atypical dual specificity phosphatase
MRGFYWLIEGELAGCPLPGASGGRAMGDSEALETDLAWLRARGIGALLTMTEAPLPGGALARHGIASLHLPVRDMAAPSVEQLARALEFVDGQRTQGRAVAVHCLMGQGRTGTVLAAYLIRAGQSADEAVAEVRARCPGAIESPAQVRALAAYAARREWIM